MDWKIPKNTSNKTILKLIYKIMKKEDGNSDYKLIPTLQWFAQVHHYIYNELFFIYVIKFTNSWLEY